MPESPTYRVVVVEPGYESYEAERAVLAPLGAAVEPVAWHGDEGVIAAAVRDADAVLVRESPIRAAAIDNMRRCRAIVRYGVGVDNVDLEAARRRRIYVANIPDYGVDEVSDHAVALALAVRRRLVGRDRDVRRGAWNVGQREKIHPLRGGTLGLVGYGRIARQVHAKMLPFGTAEVLVHDPYLTDAAAADAGVARVDLDDLCRRADVISLHAALTPETWHLIDAGRLALMKPTAVLVNTARGPLVDEAALVAALRAGRLFGAGLDVFETEPLRADNPLLGLDNAVLTDHTAWYSEASVRELQTKGAAEVARVLSGAPPRCWVNRWDEPSPRAAGAGR